MGDPIDRPRAGRRLRVGKAGAFAWLLPCLLVYGLFYAVPLGQMILRSLSAPAGGLSLENYAHVAGESVYLITYWTTLKIGVLVTLAALLTGYPLAYWIASLDARAQKLAMILVLLPFWSSVLVRNYAFVVLLSPRGIINSALLALGLIKTPLPLIYNVTGVVITTTYVLIPFMVLALVSVMARIDAGLLRASASLGARPLVTFWRVYVPLSVPGIWAGCLLVFITAIGFFITPALLGGGRVPMIATVIEAQVRGVLNWGVGSALGTILLAAVFAVYLLFDRLLGVEHLLGERR